MQGTNLAESLSASLNKREIMGERLRGFTRTGRTQLDEFAALGVFVLPCFRIGGGGVIIILGLYFGGGGLFRVCLFGYVLCLCFCIGGFMGMS